MKKFSHFLVLAALLLVLPLISLADDTTVFIPDLLGKLSGVPSIDDIWNDKVFFLDVDFRRNVFKCWFSDAYGRPFVPDLAVLEMENTSYVLKVNKKGYARVELDDEDYGIAKFTARKTYADGTSTDIAYNDDGAFTQIQYTMPDTDFFRTGMDKGESTVMYLPSGQIPVYFIKDYRVDGDDYYSPFWIASAASAYPESSYIRSVFTAWREREIKKSDLATYRISYAPGGKDIYEITYAPDTASIFEEHARSGIRYTRVNSLLPSAKLSNTEFIHHYTLDEVLCGLYYPYGTEYAYAVSGSGNELNNWYEYYGTGNLNGVPVNNNGKQVRTIQYPCTYFKSPRVID